MLNTVFKEAKKICITLTCLYIVFIIVALFTKTFDYTIFVGILLGFVYTILNFFLLGTIVEKAVFKSPRSAKRYIQINYFIRYILTAIIIILGFISPYINPWCVVISLFAPKLTYFAIGFYQLIFKKGGKKIGC